MKVAFAALLFATVLPVVNLRAAEPRKFEGVDLEELMQTQQLRDMPEIYERDPANRRRYRLLKSVVQLPLGEAWLTYNPDRDASYLNKVPGENAATYFGPIAGDAFEIFKLEGRFISKLRQDYAGDVLYRIDLMLRTGNENLRERAVRIMTAGLAADISAETRVNHLPKFKELAVSLEGDDVAPLLAAIAQTEKRIDELTVTLSDADYGPGNDELARQGKLQDWMKPSAPPADSAWGEVKDGLRAAAVFSTTHPKLGDEVTVWLLVENASQKEIRFGSSDVMQSARPKIMRVDGPEVESRGSWFSGLSPIQRHRLKQGERLTLARKTIVFEEKGSTKNAGFGGNRVAAGPGEYRVRYESVLATGSAWGRQDDGLMHRTYPAKGEWKGYLSTAETKIVVAGQAAAVGEPKFAPAGEEALGARPSTGTKAIQVTALDGTGKQIREFRVIAGVKSSFTVAATREVVSWQPHTLRFGQDGVLSWPLARAYDLMALRVEADGYAPQVSAWLAKKNPHDVAFQLIEDNGILGRVLRPDGSPAVNATVALAMVQRAAVLIGGELHRPTEESEPEAKPADQWRWPRFAQTDERGLFRLPAENDVTAALLITHEGGVREMSLAEFKQGIADTALEGLAVRSVTLQAWGRIEGCAQWGSVPGTNRSVSLSNHRDTYGYPGVIAQSDKTTTGADGRFVFERVLPGLVQLSCPMPAGTNGKSGIMEVNLPGMITHVTVQPGTNAALLGGQGRTVKGRLTGGESYADVTFHFHPTAPHIGFGGDGEIWSAWGAFQKSDLGPIFFRDGLKVNADGAFEISAVLPGDYQIFFTRAGEKAHVATGKFVVPAESPGTRLALTGPEICDIGEMRCRAVPLQ